MLYTDFPDQFDPDAVQVLWDAFNGKPFDARRAGLAALNVSGYLINKFTSTGGAQLAAMDAPTPEGEAADKVFQAALDHAKDPTLATGVPWWAGPLISLLLRVILPSILKNGG